MEIPPLLPSILPRLFWAVVAESGRRFLPSFYRISTRHIPLHFMPSQTTIYNGPYCMVG
uniref:Uncharacterized protein n=1 Tax=Wuchereria bancrofti TaxID=6293 RepID=A0AAF5RXR0_WUCBA